MNLGFGDRNNEIGQATAQALMRGAEVQENGLESEMAQYDRLLDDEVSTFEKKVSFYVFQILCVFKSNKHPHWFPINVVLGCPRGPPTKTHRANEKTVSTAATVQRVGSRHVYRIRIWKHARRS